MSVIKVFEKALIDVRWIYLGGFIILFLFVKVHVPIVARPTEMTMGFYNVVMSCKPGDIIMADCLFLRPIWGQVIEMNRGSTYQYLYNHGCKLIFLTIAGTYSFDVLWVKELLNIPLNVPLNQAPGYGTDFVIMDPTFTANYYLIAGNWRAGGTTDLFGTSFDNLPLLKNIKDGTQIYATVQSALGADEAIAFGRVGVKCIATGCSGAMTVGATYYGVGYFKGLLIGIKGGMEMDQLLGLGTDTKAFRGGVVFTAIATYSLVCVLVFNAVNYYSMRVRKRGLSMRRAE